MLSLNQIRTLATENKARIAIGDSGENERIKHSVNAVMKKGITEVEVFHDAHELVSALGNGDIQGAVRGTLEAKSVLDALKSQFEVARILRIAFMVLEGERVVLLAPVGVDEGTNIKEKFELIQYGCKLLAKFNVEAKVGILSGGRPEDYGRNQKVDETLNEGEKLTKQTQEAGNQSQHFGILLEKAFESSDMVVPFDGISGNLIFRTLHFFGGASGIGAFVVNIPRVFVDTSRAKKDYSDSIALASALCGL